MHLEGTEGGRKCGVNWYENTNELLTLIIYSFFYNSATSISLRANPLFKSWFSADTSIVICQLQAYIMVSLM
jgi:hypothetical protein